MHLLVSPDELAAHLTQHAPNTILLDSTLAPPGSPANPHAAYLQQHLPGALFFDLEALSDPHTTLPHMLAPPAHFAAAVAALGLSPTAHIVVYEQGPVFSAPRAWFTLRTYGFPHVSVLHGGLQAWLAAGLPISSGPVTLHPVAPTPLTLDTPSVTTLPQLQQALATHTQVLDARSSARFLGTAPEPRPHLPSGHMPGATSLPYATLTTPTHFKPADELRAIFAAHHISLQAPIITTCGSGITAAVLALALHLAGAPHVSLYDGSWAEYASHPSALIEPPPIR